jgi:hypothetical protein
VNVCTHGGCRVDAAPGSQQQQQQEGWAAGGPTRVRAFLPHICLVAAMPSTPHQPPAPPWHGYSYVVADLGMGPQPGAVLVRGLQQLGPSPSLGEVQVRSRQFLVNRQF